MEGEIRAGINWYQTTVPMKCEAFLEKLGWMRSTVYHPDTGEAMFHKPPPVDCSDENRKNWNHELAFSHWRWYEAMAYEFGKFMGIDEDTGGPSNQEQMGSASAAPQTQV